jgi:hypothetical protein
MNFYSNPDGTAKNKKLFKKWTRFYYAEEFMSLLNPTENAIVILEVIFLMGNWQCKTKLQLRNEVAALQKNVFL